MPPNGVRTPIWKRVEIISLPLVVAVLIATGVSAATNWRAYLKYRDEVTASRDLIESSNALFNSVLSAESAQRGYLLTGNSRYRVPYDRAVLRIPEQISHLKKSALKDGAESAQIARVLQLVNLRIFELGEAMRVRDAQGFQAALSLVESNTNQNNMERLRDVSGRLVDAESKRLTELVRIARARGGTSWVISATGDLVLGMMLVAASIVIFRVTARREELIGKLQEDDKRLRELTAASEIAQERVRNILESIADGFISFDRTWTITYVNAEAERILGRPKAELLGKNYWLEFPDSVNHEIGRTYRQAAAGQAPVSFETHFDDRNAWWEMNIYPGKDGVLSVYFRDVTERKRFEERLRHSQKLESLGVLAGGIAHDFNNLLTAILGSASLVADIIPNDSPAAPFIGNVLTASERAAQLTRQMLAYSGRGRFIVERTDLSGQVREISALLHATLGGNIELTLNLQDGAFIEADCGQLQSVVMNLVINAAEAVGQNSGKVNVSTSFQDLDGGYLRDNLSGDDLSPGRYVLLEVQDTGQGMDEATVARIFDPFFTTKFTGRGLGLAAVIGIVRGHKGAIKVHSHLGQGTTFKLYFPAVSSSTPQPLPVPVKDHHGNATVLVVDDEDVVLRMAQSTLQRYGYRVLTAANGAEAIDIFKVEPERVAVVLLDMTMPVMSGEETLRALKTIRGDVNVILSSGYNEIEALRRFGAGVAGFLQKPYRASALAEKIKEHVSMRPDGVL